MGPQRSDDHLPMSEINVTPLVDVMLVLLVVFIVAAPLLMQAVQVALPKTAPVPRTAESRTAQITVDAAGAIHVDGRPCALAELGSALQGSVEAGTVEVQLHADERVAYGHVAQVMAAAQRAGVSRLSFVTAAAKPASEPAGAPAPQEDRDKPVSP
jgi:biopolymer transport protein ExbD